MVMQMVHFWCPIRLRSWHERIYTKTGKYQGYHKDIKRKYRVKNNEELDGAIYEMLQLLGKCSGADRVYIFDKKEKNRKEYFCLQYEWKNEDDILEKEQLFSEITVEDIPHWTDELKKGLTIQVTDCEELSPMEQE